MERAVEWVKTKNNHFKIITILLSILLALSLVALAGTLIYRYITSTEQVTVMIPHNMIASEDEMNQEGSPVDSAVQAPQTQENSTPLHTDTQVTANNEIQAALISLYQKNAQDNVPFHAINLFPGDTETQYFCIRVSHSGDVTVRYHADIRDGYEKLSEVLKCRVVLLTTGQTQYDGLMRDMPESLAYSLSTQEATVSELYYQITVYLDTSVGNEYQNKNLVADFLWWVQETGNLGPSPQTGDRFSIWLYIGLASVSLFMILLLKKRRKEDHEHAR